LRWFWNRGTAEESPGDPPVMIKWDFEERTLAEVRGKRRRK